MTNSPDLVQYFTRPIYNPNQYCLMDWRKLLIGKWSWKRPFYTIFWCYILLTFYGYFMADNIIFQPPETPYPKNRAGFSSIGTADKTVAIFHLKPGPEMPTILWSHGNAQNLNSLKPALESFHIRGFGVISYDYPGYGESGGKPTEKGCYEAIEETYRYLIEDQGVAPDHIILVGQSVGSGPTCWLASQKNHNSIVLISPFLSAYQTVTHIPIFPGDRFPNYRHLKKVDSPLVVIHGEKDQVVPFSNGKRLFELSPATNKKLIPIPNAGHNDIFLKSDLNLSSLFLEMAAK
ncbi:MAG: alpha/beta hydrolase [Akkermansiaceae bacterium]|nr:alpha/beta hydrolase [Akkermansiaceae bacterium]